MSKLLFVSMLPVVMATESPHADELLGGPFPPRLNAAPEDFHQEPPDDTDNVSCGTHSAHVVTTNKKAHCQIVKIYELGFCFTYFDPVTNQTLPLPQNGSFDIVPNSNNSFSFGFYPNSMGSVDFDLRYAFSCMPTEDVSKFDHGPLGVFVVGAKGPADPQVETITYGGASISFEVKDKMIFYHFTFPEKEEEEESTSSTVDGSKKADEVEIHEKEQHDDQCLWEMQQYMSVDKTAECQIAQVYESHDCFFNAKQEMINLTKQPITVTPDEPMTWGMGVSHGATLNMVYSIVCTEVVKASSGDLTKPKAIFIVGAGTNWTNSFAPNVTIIKLGKVADSTSKWIPNVGVNYTIKFSADNSGNNSGNNSSHHSGAKNESGHKKVLIRVLIVIAVVVVVAAIVAGVIMKRKSARRPDHSDYGAVQNTEAQE